MSMLQIMIGRALQTVLPTPSVTPSATMTPTPTVSFTPSVTRSVTPTASVTPSITKSVTPTPSTSLSMTPTMTPTPSSIVYACDTLAEVIGDWDYSSYAYYSSDIGNPAPSLEIQGGVDQAVVYRTIPSYVTRIELDVYVADGLSNLADIMFGVNSLGEGYGFRLDCRTPTAFSGIFKSSSFSTGSVFQTSDSTSYALATWHHVVIDGLQSTTLKVTVNGTHTYTISNYYPNGTNFGGKTYSNTSTYYMDNINYCYSAANVTPTPTPTPSVSPTISFTPTPSVTPSIDPSPSVTPSVTPSASMNVTPTPSTSYLPTYNLGALPPLYINTSDSYSDIISMKNTGILTFTIRTQTASGLDPINELESDDATYMHYSYTGNGTSSNLVGKTMFIGNGPWLDPAHTYVYKGTEITIKYKSSNVNGNCTADIGLYVDDGTDFEYPLLINYAWTNTTTETTITASDLSDSPVFDPTILQNNNSGVFINFYSNGSDTNTVDIDYITINFYYQITS